MGHLSLGQADLHQAPNLVLVQVSLKALKAAVSCLQAPRCRVLEVSFLRRCKLDVEVHHNKARSALAQANLKDPRRGVVSLALQVLSSREVAASRRLSSRVEEASRSMLRSLFLVGTQLCTAMVKAVWWHPHLMILGEVCPHP